MTIDFVPIQQYTDTYHHVVLLFVIATLIHSLALKMTEKQNFLYLKIAGAFLFAFVLLYMGFRPIHEVFVDMPGYNRTFTKYATGGEITLSKDYLFQLFMKFCSYFMNSKQFFFTCATLYVVPLYFVCRKWFQKYWFYAFLMLVGSFSFWAYGVNVIRNGIATSLFLLAISREKRMWQIIWLVIACSIHASMLLPTLGFVITWFYNRSQAFFYFWLAAIPLSLAFPGFWENLFAGMIGDDRASFFTDDTYADLFSRVGFRWDFLLYSATGVFAGWYYILKRKYSDKIYLQLFNTYLFANAFWILVIRASFSDRFAYLSWFMLALVIIYPWLKVYLFKSHSRKVGLLITAYFLFTYIMNVILQ